MVANQYEKVADGEVKYPTEDDVRRYLRSDSVGTDVSLTGSWSSDGEDEMEEENEQEGKSGNEQGLSELPPPAGPPGVPDGGWGWMVVLGAIITGALVPGLFMCFGVFMNAFLVIFPDTSKTAASWIPSILNSLMNLMGPVTSLLVNIYSCRSVTLAGGIILSSGLVLSFFTNSVEALYFTYGFLGGVGSGMAFAPGLYLISQYFHKRRGVATGVCMAASSAGQIAFPYLLQYMLDEYSYRGCILVLGGITMNICVSAALYRPLRNNLRPKCSRKTNFNVKSTKRKRTISAVSQSFVAEANSFADLSTTVLQAKMNNIQIVKTEPKKKSKSKSKKSNNRKKALNEETAGSPLLLRPSDRIIVNGGGQPILTVDPLLIINPRNRSRTMSIESNWVLPGIPEEEHEGEEEVHNESKSPKNDCADEPELSPVANLETSTKDDDIYLNNNINTTVVDKLSCSRPLLPQDVTVVVTVVEANDGLTSPRLNRQLSNSSDSSQVLSCIHHPFGSIASIATIEQIPSVVKPPLLQRISTALGLNYFQNAIFYILSLSFTCLVVILGSYTMYMPTYGFTVVGLSREDSAGLVSIISMASMCGRLIIPTAPDYIRVKRTYVFSGSTLVMSGAIVMTAFATEYNFLLASLVCFGFTSGGSVAISLNVFLEYIPLKDFASFFGLTQLVVGIVVLFSSPLFGLLLDSTGDYTTAYFIMAVLGVISATIIYLDRFATSLNNVPAVGV